MLGSIGGMIWLEKALTESCPLQQICEWKWRLVLKEQIESKSVWRYHGNSEATICIIEASDPYMENT